MCVVHNPMISVTSLPTYVLSPISSSPPIISLANSLIPLTLHQLFAHQPLPRAIALFNCSSINRSPAFHQAHHSPELTPSISFELSLPSWRSCPTPPSPCHRHPQGQPPRFVHAVPSTEHKSNVKQHRKLQHGQ